MSKHNFATQTAMLLCLGLAGPAYAQSTSASDSASQQAEGLGDIVVTAQRREQRLQDVPISVTAVAGEALDRANIADTRNLTQIVPNLVFNTTNFSFQPTIRGVGTRNVTQGDETNVAIYLDGIYQPDMAAGSFSLLKVQRVEVLRGPQGTLFGRNATGGLINVITADPSEDFGGEFDVRYGRFNEARVRGYVTGGLAPGLAANLSFVAGRSDGYIKDLLRGGKFNESKNWTARGKLLFEPNSVARLVLSGGYSYVDDNTGIATFALNGNTAAKAPGVLIASEPFTTAQDNSPSLTKRKGDVNLQTSWDFGSVSLATATSYQWMKYHNIVDTDASPRPIAINDNTGISDSWQQEIRLLSDDSGPFSWIVGGYGFLAHARHDPIILGSPAAPNANVGRNRTLSFAGFGEGTFKFNDWLSLTAGARYTTEKRNFTYTRNGTVLVDDAETSFNRFTPKISLQGRVDGLGMFYGSYSRGFKSGVFNTTAPQATPTKPEELDAFEVGAKLDPSSHFRANFSFFYYKYRDIQLSARDGNSPSSVLLNAAKSTIKGAEAEFTALVTSDLNIRLNFAFIDAKYDSFPNAVVNTPRPGNTGNAQGFEDVSGKDMIRSPRSSVTLGVDYKRPLGDGELTFNGNVYLTDKYYWDFQNRLTQPSYVMVNGEIGWTSPNERFRVAVWGRNLANELVYLALLPSTNLDGATVDLPRTFGVSLSTKF